MFGNKTQFAPSSIFVAVFVFVFCVSASILYIIGPFFNLAGNFGGHANDGYIELARNILNGAGYVFQEGGSPSIHRPPAFPVFLIPVALLPDSLQQLGVLFLNSALFSGTAFFLYKLSTKYFNYRLALISVGILVLNPWLLWSIKNPHVSIFLMFFITAFTSLTLHLFFPPQELKKKLSPGSGVALGLVGAILTLTHGIMLPIVLGVFALIFIVGWSKKQSAWLKTTSLATLIVILVVAPWTYRNWVVTERFVPVIGNAGYSYFLGNSHWELGEPDPTLDLPKEESILFDKKTRALLFAGVDRPHPEVLHFFGIIDPDLDAQLTQKAIHHILENPGLFIKKLFLNGIEYYFPAFYYLYVPDIHPMSKHSVATRLFKDDRNDKLFESSYFLLLWILAGIGTVNAFIKKNRPTHFITLLGIIFTISFPYFPFVTFVGHSTYTFGTLPFLSILSTSGILCLWNRFRRENQLPKEYRESNHRQNAVKDLKKVLF